VAEIPSVEVYLDGKQPEGVALFRVLRVVTHRLRVTHAEQLDDSIAGLLAEAYETVGPGTRTSSTR
jgi:hypothetical protein